MELLGLAYLGLAVPDVEQWRRFATEVLGLMPVAARDSRTDEVRFKADEREWRIALSQASVPGLAYAGFELGSEAAFAQAIDELQTNGARFRRGSRSECDERRVRDLAVLTDPSGVQVELCWGPVLNGGFVSPVGVPRFVTGALGLGHYVVLTPDLDASMAFYTELLGFRLSDYVVIGPEMSVQFLRCTPRHHSVALTAVGPMSGLHHFALEVDDIDQVGYALERASKAGHPITATLGRHRNDRMLSFYMRSPAGFEVEVGCGVRLVDDRTWVANEFAGGDEWGHHGLTGEALAASVASQGGEE